MIEIAGGILLAIVAVGVLLLALANIGVILVGGLALGSMLFLIWSFGGWGLLAWFAAAFVTIGIYSENERKAQEYVEECRKAAVEAERLSTEEKMLAARKADEEEKNRRARLQYEREIESEKEWARRRLSFWVGKIIDTPEKAINVSSGAFFDRSRNRNVYLYAPYASDVCASRRCKYPIVAVSTCPLGTHGWLQADATYLEPLNKKSAFFLAMLAQGRAVAPPK